MISKASCNGYKFDPFVAGLVLVRFNYGTGHDCYVLCQRFNLKGPSCNEASNLLRITKHS